MADTDSIMENPTVLIVDDSPDDIALISSLLKALYKVKIANNGERALKLALTDTPPDIILLDIMMPIMDGYETCRHLKESPATMNIPVIFLTGKTEIEDEMKGFELGAVDYITKPISPPIVLARVQTHLQLKQVRDYLKDKNAFLEDEVQRRTQVIVHAQHEWERTFDTIPDFIMLLDKDHRILRANRAASEQFGKTSQELLGRHCYEVVHGLSAPPDFCPHTRLLDSKKEERSEFMEAGLGLFLDVCTTPFCDEFGQFVGSVHVARDITGRKLAEEEKTKLQGQLLQSQKMESVGRLAGGVAHDFNNMLGLIIGHAELALEQADPTHPLHADLQEIQKAANRSSDLTRQLLAFARQQTAELKVLDLNEVITNMLKMLQRLIGEDIELKWQSEANLCTVKMDPTQIDQILANLCINARDAISDTGKITIETGNITLNEVYCADHEGSVPGEYAMLIVSDDGCGMDKETREKIFEPFFTTKEMGKGTGLGLATVFGIVKQNNGFINVYSEPGQGTTFTIYLPRYVGKAEQVKPEVKQAPAQRGQETILLVEDEPDILNLTKMLLERQGYTVLAANTPGKAISLAGEHVGEINLLMTDVVMPEMNGRDLAKKMLDLYPHLKRLFTSGYTADVIANHGVLDEGVHFIQKPFSIKSLAAKVREVLDHK